MGALQDKLMEVVKATAVINEETKRQMDDTVKAAEAAKTLARSKAGLRE